MLPSLSIRRPAWRSGLLLNVPVRARARPAGCWALASAPSRSAPFRLAVSRPDESSVPSQATSSGDRIPGPSRPSSLPSSYWPEAIHPPPSGSLLFNSCRAAALVTLPPAAQPPPPLSDRPAALAPCNGPSLVSRWVPSSEMLDRNDIAASRRRMRFLLLIELAMNWGRAMSALGRNTPFGVDDDGFLGGLGCYSSTWQDDDDAGCSGDLNGIKITPPTSLPSKSLPQTKKPDRTGSRANPNQNKTQSSKSLLPTSLSLSFLFTFFYFLYTLSLRYALQAAVYQFVLLVIILEDCCFRFVVHLTSRLLYRPDGTPGVAISLWR
uniref:Uncharacterized protein n=1 Tax=Anopheles braziliensis TaxID=58242 RepID=A0A2M3ZKW8_9DIPT